MATRAFAPIFAGDSCCPPTCHENLLPACYIAGRAEATEGACADGCSGSCTRWPKPKPLLPLSACTLRCTRFVGLCTTSRRMSAEEKPSNPITCMLLATRVLASRQPLARLTEYIRLRCASALYHLLGARASGEFIRTCGQLRRAFGMLGRVGSWFAIAPTRRLRVHSSPALL